MPSHRRLALETSDTIAAEVSVRLALEDVPPEFRAWFSVSSLEVSDD